MGCDIHCYIEYRDRENLTINGGRENNWRSFGGRINPGRNYGLFGLMANVRSYDEPERCLFKPKGLPEDIGHSAADDNFLYITEDENFKETGCIFRKRAENWVNTGNSVYKNDVNGKPTWVSNPDWHSHSWLSLSEYRQVLERYKVLEQKEWEIREADRLELLKLVEEDKRGQSWLNPPCEHYDEPKYHVIEAAMVKFEEMGYESRLVFWFDN